jgi:protein SCO1/2
MATSRSRVTERVLAGVLVVLLAAIGLVLAGGKSSHHSGGSTVGSNQLEGPTLPPHLVAKNFSLTDQNGQRISLSQYRGHVVVLTFMHSLCKGACPLMANQILGALNELPDGGRNVPTMAISVDPKQDTPANRRKFLARMHLTGRMNFLNGPLPYMWKVWHDYYIEPEIGPTENHSAFVLLIDKRGIWRIGYPVSDLTPESLAHDIGVLQREPV